MQWESLESELVALAHADLEEAGEVAPCLAAFAGDELLLLAFLRPFEQGRHMDAVIEVAALAVPLGADRLVLSISGRGWKLDDPPPADANGHDARQRLLTVVTADASGNGEAATRASGWPFDVVNGHVRWGEPIAEEAEGPVVEALALLAAEHMQADTDDLARQARRCVSLGHDLYLSEDVNARLGIAAAPL